MFLAAVWWPFKIRVKTRQTGREYEGNSLKNELPLSCLVNQKRYWRMIFVLVNGNKLSKVLILICRGTKHLEDETPDKKEEAMLATSLLSLRQEIDEMKMREDKLDELIEYCQNEMKTLNNENSENCSVSKELNRYLFKISKTRAGGRLISSKYKGNC